MDIKSFVVGVACGAIIAILGGRLLHNDAGNEGRHIREPAIDSDAVQSAKPLEPVLPIIQDAPEADIQVTTELPIRADSRSDPGSQPPSGPADAFESEPKDASWAYYMEQAMLQYLSNHPSMAQFDLSNIECRTTRCRIEVFGFDESTVPVWQQLMYDLRHQPWSEFGQYGTSSGMIDGRLAIVGTFDRVQNDN